VRLPAEVGQAGSRSTGVAASFSWRIAIQRATDAGPVEVDLECGQLRSRSTTFQKHTWSRCYPRGVPIRCSISGWGGATWLRVLTPWISRTPRSPVPALPDFCRNQSCTVVLCGAV